MQGFIRSLIATALLATVTSAALADGKALDRVKKAGKLVVAVDATYPPMESEGKDGKVEGFDVDFAAEIAKRLGVQAEFVVTAWDGIVPGLYAKRYDAIVSCMNITDERKKAVDFVEYARISQLFIA